MTRWWTRWLLASLLAFTAAAAGSASAQEQQEAASLAAIVREHPDLGTFYALLERGGVVSSLDGHGVLTVFAPTDAAFEALAPGVMEALEARAPLLALLRHHLVVGEADADALAGIGVLTNDTGIVLQLTSMDGSLYVEDARIVETDLRAANGVLHVIDAVLVPESASGVKDRTGLGDEGIKDQAEPAPNTED